VKRDGWMAGKWIVDSGKWEVGCGMWDVGCGWVMV